MSKMNLHVLPHLLPPNKNNKRTDTHTLLQLDQRTASRRTLITLQFVCHKYNTSWVKTVFLTQHYSLKKQTHTHTKKPLDAKMSSVKNHSTEHTLLCAVWGRIPYHLSLYLYQKQWSRLRQILIQFCHFLAPHNL